eukprot:3462810-Pyramimonas_sp.AAC.1
MKSYYTPSSQSIGPLSGEARHARTSADAVAERELRKGKKAYSSPPWWDFQWRSVMNKELYVVRNLGP